MVKQSSISLLKQVINGTLFKTLQEFQHILIADPKKFKPTKQYIQANKVCQICC